MPSQKPSAAQAASAARPRQPPIGASARRDRGAGGRRGGAGGLHRGRVGEDRREECETRRLGFGAGGREEGLERGLVGVIGRGHRGVLLIGPSRR